jgi:hypothetical protein
MKASNKVVLVKRLITGSPFLDYGPDINLTAFCQSRYNMELHAHAFMVIAADDRA